MGINFRISTTEDSFEPKFLRIHLGEAVAGVLWRKLTYSFHFVSKQFMRVNTNTVPTYYNIQ